MTVAQPCELKCHFERIEMMNFYIVYLTTIKKGGILFYRGRSVQSNISYSSFTLVVGSGLR